MGETPEDPRRAGFSLVELLIVVAIISILAAIAIPSLLRARVSANEASAIEFVRDARASHFPGTPITCPTPAAAHTTTQSGYVRGCTAGVNWAVPVTPGKTGVRGFGSDSSGRICMTPDGSIPNMTGHCEALK